MGDPAPRFTKRTNGAAGIKTRFTSRSAKNVEADTLENAPLLKVPRNTIRDPM